MKSFLMAIALALASLALPAYAGIDDQQFDSACRITAGHAMGTGAVYAINSTYAAILTNAHVVEDSKIVACEFWSRGHQSGKLPGQVFVSDPTIDAAVIVVPLASFGGVLPKPLSFAKTSPPVGALIKSVGCASGAWATGWEGHVTRYEGGHVYFVPPPAVGRSGSAICNEAGQIVGLLRIRTGDKSEGGAVELNTLLSRLAHTTTVAYKDFKPDPQLTAYVIGCPGGVCPTSPEPEYGDGLFFRRQQAAPPISGNPWPTLPAGPSLSPPAIDYGPELNHIADLLQQRQTPPTPAGPDPSTIAAITTITGQVDRQGQQIQSLTGSVQAQGQQIGQLASGLGEVAKQIKDTGDQVSKIDAAVKPLEAIKSRLDEDIQAGGLKGRIAQQIENAAGSDDSLRKVLITTGVVLGLVLFIAIAIIHTIRTGKGPVGTVVDQLAAANPTNSALQLLKSQIDGLDAKIAAVGNVLPNLATAGVATAAGGLPVGVAAALQGVQAQVNTLAQNAHATALATPSPLQTASTTAATTPAASPVTVQLGSGAVSAAPAAAAH